MSKEKRKNFFSNQGKDAKRRKRNNRIAKLELECGMKGFLCTCNFREKECIREAYNLLNEYADKIYGSEEKQIQNNEVKPKENDQLIKENCEEEKKEENVEESESTVNTIESKETEKKDNDNEEEDDDEEEEEDISTALDKEINELKAEAGKPLSEKKFQVIGSGVTNTLFINSNIPDTLELFTAILKDIHENQKQKTRFLIRMLPILTTCKANMNDIRSTADTLFESYFAQEPKTFSIVFKCHYNANVKKDQVIEDLAMIILKKNPGNKADLKNPDIAVVVTVLKTMCLFSIAPKYFMYKKYNLLELCKNNDKT